MTMRLRPDSSDAPSLLAGRAPLTGPRALAAALLMAAASTACVSSNRMPIVGVEASAPAVQDAEADETDLEEKLEAAKDGVDEARRKLAYAEAEREIAGLKAEAKALDVAERLRSLEFKAETARNELKHFRDVTLPIEAEDAILDVQDAQEGVITAETDLQGLEDIFAEEVEASAKPEILRRGRRRLERAQARLAIQEKKSTAKMQGEMPAKERQLVGALAAAEAELAGYRAGQRVAEVEARLELRKAADAVEQARRGLERAERKQAKLRDRASKQMVGATEDDA